MPKETEDKKKDIDKDEDEGEGEDKGLIHKFTGRYIVTLAIAFFFLVLGVIFQNLYFGWATGGIALSILANLLYDEIKEAKHKNQKHFKE